MRQAVTQRNLAQDLTLRERIAWSHKKIWLGSQSQMARDLGVNQSSISMVLSGCRPPGRKLLLALAAHPLIDEGWILQGKGDPLRTKECEGNRANTAPDNVLLPVSMIPLPGPLHDHAAICCGVRPASASLASHTRYWYRLPADLPEGLFRSLFIAPGDALLMETDLREYTDLGQLDSRLCVIQLPDRQTPELRQISMIGHAGHPIGTAANDEHAILAKGLEKGSRTLLVQPAPMQGKRFRQVTVMKTTPTSDKTQAKEDTTDATRQTSTDSSQSSADIEVQLLAVCIRMERTWEEPQAAVLRQAIEELGKPGGGQLSQKMENKHKDHQYG